MPGLKLQRRALTKNAAIHSRLPCCLSCPNFLRVALPDIVYSSIGSLPKFCCALQVYIRPGALPELPEVLFLLLYSLLDAYTFQRRLSLLERKDAKAPDAVALSCGIATLLQQFHPSYIEVRQQMRWITSQPIVWPEKRLAPCRSRACYAVSELCWQELSAA